MRILARPGICTLSPESLGHGVGNLGNSSSAAWPAANDALFVPFNLSRPAFVQRMYVANGATASGNIDVGIYTYDGGRIVSIGSTAQAGTSALQFFNITDTLLKPDRYYMAVAKNDTTGTVRRFNTTIIRQQQMGVVKMATAFALPAVATFATVTATVIPLVGMELFKIV